MAESIVKETKAKSILVASKLPAADYVINPYTGCSFGCSYCYASFMGRFVGKSIKDWGNYVFAKTNLGEVLEEELQRIKDKSKTILLSSVTDPYLGAESKYLLTRKALELLLKHDWQGRVSILTKSPLVTRDVDLFKKFKSVKVGLTVTTTEDGVSRFLERSAPPASLRLKALKELHQAGLKTYAFVGPLLPHFSAKSDELKKIFDALAGAGVSELFIEHINLSSYIRQRLSREINGGEAEVAKEFYAAKSDEYREQLDHLIKDLLKNYRFDLKLGKVIYHKEK